MTRSAVNRIDLDEALLRLAARDAAVALDLGCGGGALARSLAAQGFRCIGVDRDAIPRTEDGVTFVRADLGTFDPGVATCDLVVARHVLQFFDVTERRDLFRRAIRALRPEAI